MLDQLSILKEVGNIAAGHGAKALSEILGKSIALDVPSTDIIACQALPESVKLQKTGMGVFAKVLTGLQGEVAFMLDDANIFKLIDMSYKLPECEKRSGIMTEMGLSLVKEIGNVIIASYLNALSLVLKRVIVPTIPTLISGSIDEILNIIIAPYAGQDFSFLVETSFSDKDGNVRGSFYLVITPATAKDISDTCRKQVHNGD